MYKITIKELKEITKILDTTSNLFYEPKDLLVNKQVAKMEKVKKQAKNISKKIKTNFYL